MSDVFISYKADEEKKRALEQLYGEGMSYQYGEIYAQLRQPHEALTHLERAWAIKDAGLLGLRVDPWLDPIRNEPRFVALMKKMKFPGA